MTDLKVVGDGVFGTFIKRYLSQYPSAHFVGKDQMAEHIIIAVPFSSYESVAQAYENCHLINMCSVQEDTNNICKKYSDKVTGIHPMFGKMTSDPQDNKVCLVTHRCAFTNVITDIFRYCGALIKDKTPSGKPITGEWHDQLMAHSHAKLVSIMPHISNTLESIKDIDDSYLPISVQKMRSLANQFEDMPKGTTSSILSNKYIPRRNAMMNDKDMTFRTELEKAGEKHPTLFLNNQDRIEF
jgi:prephenate dehydrogenase